MGTYSNHACDSGLREVTDPLKESAVDAIRDLFKNGTTDQRFSDAVLAAALRARLKENGLMLVLHPEHVNDPPPDTDIDENTARALCGAAWDTLQGVELDDEEMERGLALCGEALDSFVDDATNGRDAAYQEGYYYGHQEGHDEGYSEGKADAEEAASCAPCPRCNHALARDTVNAHVLCCTNCGSEWRLTDVRVPTITLTHPEPVFNTPERAVTRTEYLRNCGLESAPLSAREER